MSQSGLSPPGALIPAPPKLCLLRGCFDTSVPVPPFPSHLINLLLCTSGIPVRNKQLRARVYGFSYISSFPADHIFTAST